MRLLLKRPIEIDTQAILVLLRSAARRELGVRYSGQGGKIVTVLLHDSEQFSQPVIRVTIYINLHLYFNLPGVELEDLMLIVA